MFGESGIRQRKTQPQTKFRRPNVRKISCQLCSCVLWECPRPKPNKAPSIVATPFPLSQVARRRGCSERL